MCSNFTRKHTALSSGLPNLVHPPEPYLFAVQQITPNWQNKLILPRLFQITNLMHNSFIFQQYVCYATLQSALHPRTVRPLVKSDDTRGCGDTIGPPEDEQCAAQNMLRSVA